jgi:glutathionylspermidine synthase
MQRNPIDPRPTAAARIQNLGYGFHSMGSTPGWDEKAYMAISHAEQSRLKLTAETVQRLCMSAMQKVISDKLFPILGISVDLGKIITQSWNREDAGICSRINFVDDGMDLKMISYDADNPSRLFETAVMQEDWIKDVFPQAEQWNSLHQQLITQWQRLAVGRYNLNQTPLYLAVSTPDLPEELAVNFMGWTAQEAGWAAQFIPLQRVGWNGSFFTNDWDEGAISWVYKRYPWWRIMGHADHPPEEFSGFMMKSGSIWMEPLWKIVMESKCFMALLWEMYPGHPNLLPTYMDNRFSGQSYVKKPAFGHNGQNIEIRQQQVPAISQGGDCGDGDFVYQGFAQPIAQSGYYPYFGVWMVNDTACALSVCESDTLITNNGARFVPHILRE